jgi:hypothetical protein
MENGPMFDGFVIPCAFVGQMPTVEEMRELYYDSMEIWLPMIDLDYFGVASYGEYVEESLKNYVAAANELFERHPDGIPGEYHAPPECCYFELAYADGQYIVDGYIACGYHAEKQRVLDGIIEGIYDVEEFAKFIYEDGGNETTQSCKHLV